MNRDQSLRGGSGLEVPSLPSLFVSRLEAKPRPRDNFKLDYRRAMARARISELDKSETAATADDGAKS